MAEVFAANLLSPIVLSFVLGLFCKMVGSDFRLPREIYAGFSIYLLFALGLKGGVELAEASIATVGWPILVTLLLGCVTPISAYFILRRVGKFSTQDAAGIAAHYGSVSAVTYLAAQAFMSRAIALDPTLPQVEGFMPTLLTLLESPGICVALALGVVNSNSRVHSRGAVIREILTGRTMVLLVGGMCIGFLTGHRNWEGVATFYDPMGAIFKGVLCLFLLEMGVVAAQRLGDLRKVGLFLLGFGLIVPVLHGALGVLLGTWCGLSIGGCTILGSMAASASYIAAPPAVRMTLPDANPTYSLTSALVITFPFNVILGIPLYFQFASWIR